MEIHSVLISQLVAKAKKKHSLTTSLSNMMSQLNVVQSGGGEVGQVPEDDAMSFRSDDSDSSESFVVINQAVAAAEADSVDATLFAIHSKRASPDEAVEMATEVTEDTVDMSSASTPSKGGGSGFPSATGGGGGGGAGQDRRDRVVSTARRIHRQTTVVFLAMGHTIWFGALI